MRFLAQDPKVEALVVVTDGLVRIPDLEPPYRVLWATTREAFKPPYGHVIQLKP